MPFRPAPAFRDRPIQYGQRSESGGLDENISVAPGEDAWPGYGFLSVAVSGTDAGDMAWLHVTGDAILGVPLDGGRGTINVPLLFGDGGSVLVSVDGATAGTVEVVIVYPVAS